MVISRLTATPGRPASQAAPRARTGTDPMHKQFARAGLLALCLGLFAAAAAGQDVTPPGMLPAPPVKKTLPELKSILVVESEPRAQMERLKEIRKRPDSDGPAIVAWITGNRDRLPAPYLYERARRSFAGDPDAAMMWFALGTIRARYAAMRCIDRSARGSISFLTGLAVAVARRAAADRAAWGKAGLAALETKPLFPGAVSPAWLCLSGFRAAAQRRSGLTPKPEDFIAPVSEWPKLRADVRAEQTRYFTEQGKPQEDPVPPSARKYGVEDFAGGYEYRKFAWLDAGRLLFDREKAGERGNRALAVWTAKDGAKEVEKIGSAFDSQWCAGDGFVFRTLGRASGKDFKQTIRYGRLGATTDTTISPGAPVELARQSITNMKSYRAVSELQQSPFDCRLVERKGIDTGGTRNQWLPLRQGDGFLIFKEDKPNRDGTAKTKVVHMATRDPGSAKTLIEWPFIQKACVRYFAFKAAYFIQPCALGRGSMRKYAAAQKLTCIPVWWFTPKDGAVTRACTPVDSVIDSPAVYEPSKAGLIRIVYQRNTYHGRKPGGIYLTGTDGKTVRIHTGAVESGAVSPDGCTLAFREVAPVGGRWQGVLKVMGVC